MAKKNDKVSVSAFDKYVKDNCDSRPIQIEVGGLSFMVKPVLSFEDLLTFAKIVADSCFSDNGEFVPEVREFMIRRNILERYAGFTMPQNLEKQYELVTMASEVIDEIVAHVDQRQFRALLDAIGEKIDAKQMINESAVTKQVNELYGFMANMQSQLESMFAGVDSGDMARLVSAISEGGLDQEQIVKAYFDYKKDEGEGKAGDM